MRDEMVTAWRQASTAEVLWATQRGPRGIPVVPLVWPQDQTPCAAVPLSHLDEVNSLSHNAAFTVHTRHAPAKTLLATGRVDIRLDLAGEDFIDHLLTQEAAKHPPTRLRADSLMARRENWWWLPRVLITLTETAHVHALPARTRPEDALLVRQRPDDAERSEEPDVTVVAAAHWPNPGQTSQIELWSRDGAALNGNNETAFVFGHRHSPDFERWQRWYRSGTLQDDMLQVWSGDGAPQPGDEHAGAAVPFTLRERWSNHRRTVKACKAGIAQAEKHQR